MVDHDALPFALVPLNSGAGYSDEVCDFLTR